MNAKTQLISAAVILGAGIVAGSGGVSHSAEKSGEALFKEHCVVCHPDGGNIVNPKKTLRKKDREANNLKTKEDIVKQMRNPGPGMSKFDKKMISDHDAKEIAEYIFKTFNK